jgi:hypothetical protein
MRVVTWLTRMLPLRQQHHRSGDAGQRGQHFGVAGVMAAGLVQRFLS